MGALFWIGIVLFVIGVAARLVISVKIRNLRDGDITVREFDKRTVGYRRALYVFAVMSLVGITIAIFSI